MRLACLIILSTVFAIQSCKNDDSASPALPQTGRGILNYTYEGKQYIRLKNIRAEYFTDTLGGYSNFFIYIKGNNGELSTADTNVLYISLSNISKPGVYPIGNIRIIKPIEGKNDWVYLGYSGTVDITKLDTVNHIWSGKFSVNMSIESIAQRESLEPKPINLKDSISIKDGWFDLPLTKAKY